MQDQQFGTKFSCHESTSKILSAAAHGAGERKKVETSQRQLALLLWSHCQGPQSQVSSVYLTS